MLYVNYDLKATHEENDVIETEDELKEIKGMLGDGKHKCLVLRIEHPRCHEVLL